MKEVVCKVCKKNKCNVSDNAVSAICSTCVMQGRFSPESPIPKERVDGEETPHPKKPSRYAYRSTTPHGHRSKIIDQLILSGKEIDQIIQEIKVKFPGEEDKRVRNLVYVRRGALKVRGKLPKKVEEKTHA